MQALVLVSLLGAAFALGFFFQAILDKLLWLCVGVGALFLVVAALVYAQAYLESHGVDVLGAVLRLFDFCASFGKLDWRAFTWNTEF